MGWSAGFATRRLQPEWMDEPGLDPSLHRAALRGLSRINRVSRTAATLFVEVERIARERPGAPLRVLDVACGGSEVTRDLARLAARKRLPIRFDGCDISETALEYARSATASSGVDVGYIRCDVLRDSLPAGYDCLVSSLFLHHLGRDDVSGLLSRMAAAARAVVVSDLLRSRGAYVMAHVATRLLSRSPVVHVDGPRSVRAAFTLEEMRDLCEEAGMVGVVLRPVWPKRFILTWKRPCG